ncbi:S-layer homology domain-containing protein [Bacillus sp. CGMCC 1.16541]|uniref:S-layer homology domain-containing protein n=1 Tax=Bacillus sp. CGMCC 1.16541 TaxID=2185143 RepID=UPI000D73F10B|nr:S-layer homology domain-containing protein [Bacillus sp. CGMCC 1.16541]
MLKKLTLCIITFVLLLCVASPSFATNQKVNYVALGDSLAEGLLFDKTFGKSYTELISEHLLQQKKLNHFSKEFAVSGYKTSDLLKDLQENKVKNDSSLHDTIKQANLLTIHIGANDFLSEIKLNPETQTIEFDQAKAPVIIAQVQSNLTAILKEIRKLNPQANVIVLGYYYPFVHLDAPDQEVMVRTALTLLNAHIQQVSVENGARFISLDQVFSENPKQYLPNPTNPHPNNEGYAVIAKAIISQLEQPPTQTYKDVSPSHWAFKEISMLTETEILTETKPHLFSPETAITRADAAKALLKSAMVDQAVPTNPNFKDIPTSHDAYYAIAKLTEAGIFNKADYFNPDKPLTRAQMAKILTRMFDLHTTETHLFKDIPTDFWAKPYIDILATLKITTGYDDQTYRPNKFTTRAQFAAFLVRTMEAKVNVR